MSFTSEQQEQQYKLQATGSSELVPVLATFYVWSAVGHTPVTKRDGAYCDELAKVQRTVYSRCEAEKVAKQLLETTPFAASARFDLGTEYWNHNLRTGTI